MTYVVCLTSVAYIVNIHSYWKQGALGATGVRDGLQLGRSVRRTAGGDICRLVCRLARSNDMFGIRYPTSSYIDFIDFISCTAVFSDFFVFVSFYVSMFM